MTPLQIGWTNHFIKTRSNENGPLFTVLKLIWGKRTLYEPVYRLHKMPVMEATAVMILLADQPLITTEMINELLLCFQTNSNIGFVACSYDGLARPPVIFARRMLPDLLQLQGDQGARHVIRKEKSGIHIDFAIPDLFIDVDTTEDYSILLEKVAFWKS